jgi:His-Xaa-Ser system protein HxsD
MATDVVLEFDQSVQSLAALHAAAYRLIGIANAQIKSNPGRWMCQLVPVPLKRGDQAMGEDQLRSHFLDLVADENLREVIAARTEPVRNLILSLAFGSLVAPQRSDAAE